MIGLRPDLEKEGGAAFAGSVAANHIAIDVHVAMVIVEINPVALAAAVNEIVPEGLVAIPVELVITVPPAHVVRDFAVGEDFVVFKDGVPTAEQDARVRRVMNEIVRHVHPHRRMVAAAPAARVAAVDPGGINLLDAGEVMDLVVHRAMIGGNARRARFVAPAQPDPAGA